MVPGRKVLDQDVGRGDEILQDLQALGLAKIETQSELVAIEHHRIDAVAADLWLIAAAELAFPRLLDLDHFGTHVA